MRPIPEKSRELDQELDLPALDGDDDALGFGGLETDDVHVRDDGGDALDDKTGEDAPLDELHVEGSEGGWLTDTETASTLDIGPIDVSIQAEGRVLDDDEPELGGAGLLDDVVGDETHVVDSGEEGPTDEDEELREEDLPALDADDDGDVSDDELYDRSLLGADEDIRWDDRAWAPFTSLEPEGDEAEDSGVLPVPSDESPRDVAWRELEKTNRSMAAAFVPGGSVIVALANVERSRAMLVRIQPDGEARIIAEIDPKDDDDCTVMFMRWDAPRGCLVIGGSFGVTAYQPTRS